METRKLYYEDCHLTEFTATVQSCQKTEKGWEVVLDATAFYPEGGGQDCDQGTLGCSQVLHVREAEGQVIHLCDAPLPIGEEVTGKLCWERRFDLMQQHTGEHIVSGIIHRIYGWHNVGFHVGAETVTIDFDGPVPEPVLEEIQRQANEAVWQNLPVKCWYPSPQELPQVGYRTKKDLPWPVRVVEIPGYDKCACCGVHTAFTGEIGLIKFISCVKFHQGVRIEMVCGDRALAMVSRIWEQNRKISQLLSAKLPETAAAVDFLKESLAREKAKTVQLKRRIFRSIAESYRDKGNVLHIEPGLEAGEVRELADAIGQVCGGIAAVASGEDDFGYSLCILSRTADVRPLGKEAFAALQGKGGGRADAVQGNVKAAQPQIRDFFRTQWS